MGKLTLSSLDSINFSEVVTGKRLSAAGTRRIQKRFVKASLGSCYGPISNENKYCRT